MLAASIMILLRIHLFCCHQIMSMWLHQHYVRFYCIWLYPDILSSEIFNELQYNIFRRDRCSSINQRGGGIFLAISSRLQVTPVGLLHNDIEQICVLITPSSGLNCKFLICLSYVPPASVTEIYEKHVENITEASSRFCDLAKDHIVIMGDFNLPNIQWQLDPDENKLIPFLVVILIIFLLIPFWN